MEKWASLQNPNVPQCLTSLPLLSAYFYYSSLFTPFAHAYFSHTYMLENISTLLLYAILQRRFYAYYLG